MFAEKSGIFAVDTFLKVDSSEVSHVIIVRDISFNIDLICIILDLSTFTPRTHYGMDDL